MVPAAHVPLELMLAKKLMQPWEYRVAIEKIDALQEAATSALEMPIAFDEPIEAPEDMTQVINVDPPRPSDTDEIK